MIFAVDKVSIRKQILEFAAEEGYENLSEWNWKLTQKKEQRGSTEFTSYTIIPKPQTPKHKAEVKKQLMRQRNRRWILFRKFISRWQSIRRNDR